MNVGRELSKCMRLSGRLMVPKAILKFDLPEESNEFNTCLNGAKYISILQDLDQELRNKTKYAPDNIPIDTFNAYEEIRKTLRDLVDKESVDLWAQ